MIWTNGMIKSVLTVDQIKKNMDMTTAEQMRQKNVPKKHSNATNLP